MFRTFETIGRREGRNATPNCQPSFKDTFEFDEGSKEIPLNAGGIRVDFWAASMRSIWAYASAEVRRGEFKRAWRICSTRSAICAGVGFMPNILAGFQ